MDAIREEERRLISREIHDQIGQALTPFKLEFGWLRGRLPADAPPEVRERAAAIEYLTGPRVAGDVRERLLQSTRRAPPWMHSAWMPVGAIGRD